jgi:hypothetical protein
VLAIMTVICHLCVVGPMINHLWPEGGEGGGEKEV